MDRKSAAIRVHGPDLSGMSAGKATCELPHNPVVVRMLAEAVGAQPWFGGRGRGHEGENQSGCGGQDMAAGWPAGPPVSRPHTDS